MNVRQKQAVGVGAALALAIVGVGVVVVSDDDDGGDPRRESRSRGDETVVGDSPVGFQYPDRVEGEVGGDTVLVNDDDVVHTFTSDDGLFDSGPLDPGGELTISTLGAGTYTYHCSIHPELQGTLEITG